MRTIASYSNELTRSCGHSLKHGYGLGLVKRGHHGVELLLRHDGDVLTGEELVGRLPGSSNDEGGFGFTGASGRTADDLIGLGIDPCLEAA